MEPTGTNGRWRHNIPTLYGLVPRLSFCWIVDDIEHCPWSRFDSDRLIASRPLAGSRTATGSNPLCGWNECRNGFGSVPSSRICGGHSPGETPGPIPNPVAKARRGDGTALERVWESSAPPHPNFVWTFRSGPSWVPGRSFFISGFPSRFRIPMGHGSGSTRFLSRSFPLFRSCPFPAVHSRLREWCHSGAEPCLSGTGMARGGVIWVRGGDVFLGSPAGRGSGACAVSA